MPVPETIILFLAALVITIVAGKRRKSSDDESGKAARKACAYLVLAFLLLLAVPTPLDDSLLDDWSVWLCLILALLCIWIVVRPESDVFLEDHEDDWLDDDSGWKKRYAYRSIQAFDWVDDKVWEKEVRGVPIIRWLRRITVGVLAAFCLIVWSQVLIVGLFSPSEAPSMDIGGSSGAGTSSSQPATSAAPTTSAPAPTSVAPASIDLCDAPALNPQSPASPLDFKNSHGVEVCRDQTWFPWAGAVPTNPTLHAWARVGKFMYCKIEYGGKTVLIRATEFTVPS